jgi:hypothetical protein
MLALHPVLLEPFPRDETREEAERELSKDIYREQESIVDKVLDWIARELAELLGNATASEEGGSLAVLVLVLVVIALVVAVLIWFGPVGRNRRRKAQEAAHIEPTVDDDEHRRRADAFAAEGRYADAVRERLRAIIASLIDRGILDDRLGRTATEIALDAGRKLPTAAADLLDAATLFGAIWYGRRTATADHDAQMRAIDKRVAAARPGDGQAALATAGAWAIPSAGPPAAGQAPGESGQGQP